MRRTLVRLGLAAVMGICLSTAVLADDPGPVIQTLGPLMAEAPAGAAGCSTFATLGAARPGHPLSNSAPANILHNHGLLCYAHHNEMGCGSFTSEMRFIFGSCRTFFSQKCIPCTQGPGDPCGKGKAPIFGGRGDGGPNGTGCRSCGNW